MYSNLKISVMGASGVGKTSLIQKFIHNNTFVHTPTIGVEYFTYNHIYQGQQCSSLENTEIKFSIWDLAGGDRFRSITKSYLPSTQGIILVFDLHDPKSFQQLEDELNNLKQYNQHSLPGLVIGNKKDLSYQVDTQEAQQWAQKNNFDYLELSIKDDQVNLRNHLEKFFEKMIDKYHYQIPRKAYYYPSMKSTRTNQYLFNCCKLL